MIQLPAGLLQTFLVIDVHDPHELGADSGVSRRFPSNNNTHRYRLHRGLTARGAPERGSWLTRLAMRPVGDLLAAYVADRHATDVEIVAPGFDRFCVSAILGQSLTLRTAAGEEVQAAGRRGLVLRGEPGTSFVSSDGNARFNLWVSAQRVETMLAALLGHVLVRPLVFAPCADLSAGPGASVLRLMTLFAHELAQSDGLAANPLALNSFTDLWVQTLLHGLPHNHQDALAARHHGGPVPRHIKRAEDFMQSHAAQPIALADIAAAAGCSLRTLHLAFRRFRDTTPLAALHAMRLDAVRALLESGGDQLRPAEVARLYGFSHPGRFKAAYLRRFGVAPGARRAR
ncbi:helix-turn-helix transcriptional regulator [Pseudorhodoferax sp. Leaf267]|uniref:AraC family transcriptional regulator n=1 Tax=Pseudorhodoferax sp. Leaf267 TaxID=1736316 RepID=UPI0006FD6DE6|nr:helix-turn-helix transcriptional regulator [Pseudorhodoferax sp. Leaf267]KQP15090.1 hypothetical protein ASF43_13730 [Pseudorhodoferax sp. Leaf267]